MSESKANGPASERGASGLPNARTRADLQAECERLREEVRQLQTERERAQEELAEVQAERDQYLKALYHYVKKEFAHDTDWLPPEEKDRVDFAEFFAQLERDYGL
jgi:hypothetical protein